MGIFISDSKEEHVIMQYSRASLIWSHFLVVVQAILINDEVTGHIA